MPFKNRRRSADVLAVTDERSVLEAFLDDHRQVIADSLDGLTEAEAHRSLMRSRMTLLGLVTHAAAMERFFFQSVLVDGVAPADGVWTDVVGADRRVPAGVRIVDAVSGFETACDESRKAVSAYSLEHVVAPDGARDPVTVRWIYLRMVEELSRAAGHADILREQLLEQRDSALNATFTHERHKRIGW